MALSARAGAQLRRTRRPMGRVEYGALCGRGMYIRIASSATWNSKKTDQCIFSEETAESNNILLRLWLPRKLILEIILMAKSTSKGAVFLSSS